MARALRILYAGAFYHVFSRGNDRQPIFHNAADRTKFLLILAEACQTFHTRIHAYCLMPNHYHLFMETVEPTLSAAMRHVNGVYTQWFNAQHHRVGHLLQGRFKAILVDRETYGLELSRYIHLNPFHARLTAQPESYLWSGARYLLGHAKAPTWFETDWTLGQFGRRRRQAQGAYRRFLEEGKRQADDVLQRSRGGMLGSEAFQEQVRQRVARLKADPELPDLQMLTRRPSAQTILEKVAGYYRQPLEAIRRRHGRDNEARCTAIYLVRRLTGISHRQTAEHFGGIGYTAVSQCIRRLEAQRRQDRQLDRTLAQLEEALALSVK